MPWPRFCFEILGKNETPPFLYISLQVFLGLERQFEMISVPSKQLECDLVSFKCLFLWCKWRTNELFLCFPLMHDSHVAFSPKKKLCVLVVVVFSDVELI